MASVPSSWRCLAIAEERGEAGVADDPHLAAAGPFDAMGAIAAVIGLCLSCRSFLSQLFWSHSVMRVESSLV